MLFPFNILHFLSFFSLFFLKTTSMNSFKGNGSGFSLEVLHVSNVHSPLSIASLTEEERNSSLAGRKLLQFKATMIGSSLQQTHLVKIWIGTPPTLYHLMLDTGSELSWIRCPTAYKHKIFKRRWSKTYTEVSCRSPLCKPSDFNCINGKCIYEVYYEDRSGTRGVLSTDTFSSKPTYDDSTATIRNVAFGCSHEMHGIFPSGFDGILGMDSGIISFPSQHSRTFSYCLPRSNNKISFLRFGNDIPNDKPRTKVFSTPIIKLPAGVLDRQYYLNLLDISVDGKRLGLPSGTFELRNNTGGCFIDTGYSITNLIRPVYRLVKFTFVRYFEQERFVEAPPWMKQKIRLDVCYLKNKQFTVRHDMVFHFEGADFVIGTRDIFMMNDDLGVFCLAMGSSKYFTVIGNYQQRDKRFVYNVERNVLEFYPEDCSLDSSR